MAYLNRFLVKLVVMKILFGPIYLIVVIIFALHFYAGVLPSDLILVCTLYLIFKGLIFAAVKQKIMSLMDFVIGMYFILMWLKFFPNTLVTLLPVFYLVEKGIAYTWVGLKG